MSGHDLDSPIHSTRITTSSRHPGVKIVGTVTMTAAPRLAPCERCGSVRYALGGPHAPRFQGGVLVDCDGKTVVRSADDEAPTRPEVGTPAELERVSERIGEAIKDFCRRHVGQTFHADELRQHVRSCVGEVAPDSAGRVLRDLRQRGVIAYQVVNRAKSLYRVAP